MKSKLLWPALLIMVLGSLIMACDETSDDDDSEESEECKEGEPLEIDSADRDQGLNLVEQQVVLSGGCFDSETTATLVDEGGTERDLTAEAEYPSALTVTVPGGLDLGAYTIRVDRGEESAQTEYGATSNIIVSGAYEAKLYVVDMSDPSTPTEVLSFEPWPGDWTRWTSHPTVNYLGNKVYFWGYEDEAQSAIYSVDLPGGDNVAKITDDSVLHFHTPDASPTEGKVVFLGCADVGDVCDIYTANEDGTGVQMIADHLDTVLVNGDNTSSWGLWNPVFSPDGEKIAFLRETVCEGSTETDCDYDWYSVLMIMDADGGNQQVVHWEPQVRFYDFLRWTWDDFLIWKRMENDVSPQELVALKIGSQDEFTMTPLDGSWDSGWNGGGDGFVWLAYSPVDDALVFQPFNTSLLYYYPLTMSAASGSAEAGWSLDIPDGADGYFAHYNEYDWFAWQL